MRMSFTFRQIEPSDALKNYSGARMEASSWWSLNCAKRSGKPMKILDLLAPERIMPDLHASNKHGVLKELAKTLADGPDGLSVTGVMEVLLDRERLGSTSIGDNIAIPHGKMAQLTELRLSFGRSFKGVNFDSMDGKLSNLFFLLLAPVNSAGLHLKALAKIRMLMSQTFRDNLMKAPGAEEIYRLIAERDAGFYGNCEKWPLNQRHPSNRSATRRTVFRS